MSLARFQRLFGIAVSMLVAPLFCTSLYAQVSVGSATPRAYFHVATNRTVLFGPDTNLLGTKLYWMPRMAAFRAGRLTGAGNANNWTEGAGNVGMHSFAFGLNNRASGDNSVAMGEEALATAPHAFALGRNASSAGLGSIAMGISTVANAEGALALGDRSEAKGFRAAALGGGLANQNYGLALGNGAKAYGLHAAAIAADPNEDGSAAWAESSIVIGHKLVARHKQVIVLGKYNDPLSATIVNTDNPGNPLFILGNGDASPSNALVVRNNAQVSIGTSAATGGVNIHYNSAVGQPHINLLETQTNDFARIRMQSQSTIYAWDIAGITTNAANTGAQLNFFYNAPGIGDVLQLFGTGNATLKGTLTQNSDATLKKNLHPITHALEKLQQLGGYHYQWKHEENGQMQIGLLAQEVEAQFPELVSTNDKGIKSVAYGNMVAVLLQAIKEMKNEMDTLKATLQTLQSQK